MSFPERTIKAGEIGNLYQCQLLARPKSILTRILLAGAAFTLFSTVFGVSQAEARCWRCNAHIVLMGSYDYFQRNWEMCTGGEHVAPNDREKSCKNYIEKEYLTQDLWGHFTSLSRELENNICQDGSAKFKIQYGFNKRPDKTWYFESSVSAPACDCALSCPANYSVDRSSDPNRPRCVRLLCSDCADGIPNERCGPHQKGIGIWNGNVYHHRPVSQGRCRFV